MKKFAADLLKFLCTGLIAAAVVTLAYFYFDPFKVIRSYRDFSNPEVLPNREYVSAETFFRNYRERKYNSFIFGSSRTMAFRPATWLTFLPQDAKPFVFDAFGETISGIYTKIKLLDSLKVELKNVLIILCRDYTFVSGTNKKGHLFINHPKLTGKSNLDFQFEFYKTYLDPKFLVAYYDYKITNKYKPYMENYIENRKLTSDNVTNEVSHPETEAVLSSNPDKYYAERRQLFYERSGERTDTVSRIGKNNEYMLKEIKRILEKNSTSYKVILSPLYEQIKFNANDLLFLQNLFGKNLYDFSGKNTFTEDKINFYETSHYRSGTGDSILKIIYK